MARMKRRQSGEDGGKPSADCTRLPDPGWTSDSSGEVAGRWGEEGVERHA